MSIIGAVIGGLSWIVLFGFVSPVNRLFTEQSLYGILQIGGLNFIWLGMLILSIYVGYRYVPI